MSEHYTVTIETGAEEGGRRRAAVRCEAGKSLLEVLLEAGPLRGDRGGRESGGYVPEGMAGCGSRGACGRCRVCFTQGAALPGHADRRFFTPDELRDGWRLACTSKITQDCRVRLYFEEDSGMRAVTEDRTGRQAAERGDIRRAVRPDGASASEGREGYGPGGQAQDRYFVAADIGTTTVAMQLVDRSGGNIIGSYCFLNPQRAFGADVISRLQAAAQGKAQIMKELLLGRLQEGIRYFSDEYTAPAFLVLAGNTVMLHLLLGYDTSGLGQEPFTPADISGRELILCGLPALALPGISAFVGADIVAGMYACGFAGQEQGEGAGRWETEEDSPRLFIDLGTNGEMAIGSRKRIVATATAAGPAFEGGATAGIYGADMVSAAAKLLRSGRVGRDGLLAEPYFTEGIEVDGVPVCQRDIRNYQTAKAAVRAGIEILCEAYGTPYLKVAKVFLAGGFGYYLDPAAAVETGLLPDGLLSRTAAVGNSALAGAVSYGVRFGCSIRDGGALEGIIARTEVINLARQEGFGERYIREMELHKS